VCESTLSFAGHWFRSAPLLVMAARGRKSISCELGGGTYRRSHRLDDSYATPDLGDQAAAAALKAGGRAVW